MVAVKAGDVERAIRKPAPEVCLLLFYGPDAGRVSERARAAAEGAAGDPTDPFGLVRLDGDAVAEQPGLLFEEASTVSLFGGRRTVWVRPTSRNIAAAVSACLDAAPAGSMIVVEAGDLGKTSPLRVACERSRRALALPCYVDGGRDLAVVVTETLAAEGLTIDTEARAILLESLGGDRLASRGEIAKLALYARGRERVTVQDVEAVVADVSSLDLDGVIDSAFLGDRDGLQAALGQMEQGGSPSGPVLAAALRHALSLVAAVTAREGGSDGVSILQGWRGLHFRRRDRVARQIPIWSSERLARIIGRLQTTTLDSRRSSNLAAALTSAALFEIAGQARREGTRNYS